MGAAGNTVELAIQATDGFSQTYDRLGTANQKIVEELRKAEVAAIRNSDAYKELDTELEQLLTRIDPVYRAQMRLDQGQDTLSRGLASGLITQQQYSRGMGSLSKDFEAITAGAGHAAHGSSALTREFIVLGHEVVAGNMSRIPGTLMVLGSRMGGLAMIVTALGGAALAAWQLFSHGAKESTDQTKLLVDANQEAFDKVHSGLREEIALQIQKNKLQKDGVTTYDDDQAKLLFTLRMRIAAEKDVIAQGRAYTTTVRELNTDLERYAELTNQLSQKRSLEKEYNANKKSAEELDAAIKASTMTLEAQIATFGQDSAAAKEYELRLKGATDAQLTHYHQLVLRRQALEEDTKAQQRVTQLMNESRTPMQVHADRLREINDLKMRGNLTAEQHLQLMDQENKRWAQTKGGMEEVKNSTNSIIQAYRLLELQHNRSLGTTSFQLGKMLVETQHMVTQGMGRIVASVILDNANIGEMLKALMKNVASNIIASFVEIELQHAIAARIGVATDRTASTAKVSAQAGVAYAETFAGVMSLAPFPWTIPAAMAAGAAAAAALEAGAMGLMVAGVAHGGMDYVPAEQTFLLQKGERVLSPQQNQDLTSFIKGGGSGGGSGMTLIFHILENATNADMFVRMSRVELRNTLGQPVIDALNEMFSMGVQPKFMGQKR